jgi:hypothetical protein
MRLGSKIDLGALTFKPPRAGPTLWEIGVPDRSAAEFFIPNTSQKYVNDLYTSVDKLVSSYLNLLTFFFHISTLHLENGDIKLCIYTTSLH